GLHAYHIPAVGDLHAHDDRAFRSRGAPVTLRRTLPVPSLGAGYQPDRLRARAQNRHEGCRHPTISSAAGVGPSVAKNRETCASNRYVEPRTSVPPSTGVTPMTISSPPCPRKVT